MVPSMAVGACMTRNSLSISVAFVAISLVLSPSGVVADQASGASRVFGLVVVGLGGNSEYGEMFEEAAASTMQAVNPPQASAAEADSAPALVTGNRGTGIELLLENESSREEILQRLASQVEEANQHASEHGEAAARFMLMFFGHGSFDGEHYRFNIRGPDITGQDVVMALQPLQSAQQFLMFATSASGAVLKHLMRNPQSLHRKSSALWSLQPSRGQRPTQCSFRVSGQIC